MKSLILTIVLGSFFCLSTVNSQETSVTNKTSGKYTNLSKEQQDSLILAFPQFTEGTVIFSNMSQVKAKVNYNYHNQQFLFLEKEEIKKMDNLKDVVMITVGKRIFIPLAHGLGEILIDDDICLIESRKVNVEELKTGAYGSGGSTASISNLQSIDGAGTTSGMGLTSTTSTFSSNASFLVDTRFFLMKDMNTYVANKKNFLKYFPKSTKFIEEYVATVKPDYGNMEQMRTFVSLCNAKEKEAKAKK